MLTLLQRVRESKGITQEQMARLLGVTRAAYANWEQGIRTPPADMALRIAAILGYPAEALFGELLAARKGYSNAKLARS